MYGYWQWSETYKKEKKGRVMGEQYSKRIPKLAVDSDESRGVGVQCAG